MTFSKLSFLVVGLMSATAFAGDYANLDVFGFSHFGDHLAYEVYGVQDGSGYPYSNFYFVNVEKNTFDYNPTKILLENDSATLDQARHKAALASSSKLSNIGAIPGNTGDHVYTSPVPLEKDALTVDLDNPRNESVEFMYDGMKYRVGFELTRVSLPDCLNKQSSLLELVLTRLDTGVSVTLQKDKALPDSRRCVAAYRIQDIYVFRDEIAVFLNTWSPALEGPDMRYMAVTSEILR